MNVRHLGTDRNFVTMKNLISWLKENNVIIIGAGISGLTAGVYAKKSGFNVTILEHHIIPGGLSTSWTRKGYLFEGGMHWLTGSLETLSINKVWKEVGALQENNPIYNTEVEVSVSTIE